MSSLKTLQSTSSTLRAPNLPINPPSTVYSPYLCCCLRANDEQGNISRWGYGLEGWVSQTKRSTLWDCWDIVNAIWSKSYGNVHVRTHGVITSSCVLNFSCVQCRLNATIKTVVDCPANMADPVDLKVVLVGPPGTGKSSMIQSLTTNTFKTVHSPTAFDNYTAKVEDGQKTYQLR